MQDAEFHIFNFCFTWNCLWKVKSMMIKNCIFFLYYSRNCRSVKTNVVTQISEPIVYCEQLYINWKRTVFLKLMNFFSLSCKNITEFHLMTHIPVVFSSFFQIDYPNVNVSAEPGGDLTFEVSIVSFQNGIFLCMLSSLVQLTDLTWSQK